MFVLRSLRLFKLAVRTIRFSVVGRRLVSVADLHWYSHNMLINFSIHDQSNVLQIKNIINLYTNTANNSGNEHLTQAADQSSMVTTSSASLFTTQSKPGYHDTSSSAFASTNTAPGVYTSHQRITADQPDHHHGDQSTLDLESMYLMLEPNLRPTTPDASNRVSLQIYEQHNDIAREYLKVRLL